MHLRLTPSSYILALLAVTLLGFSSKATAGGLLLFSTPGSSYVNAVQYETFGSPSAHLSFVTVKGGKRVQIKSAGIVANIPFPDQASNISPKDADAMIAQTEMYAAQYPKYAKILQSVGELWKRQLETSKVAQSQPTPSVSVSHGDTESATVTKGIESTISLIKTKSGETLKNVRITRFEDNKAVITHDGGMGRLAISDIADISTLPADAKAAIQQVQTTEDAKREAEEVRIAAEKKADEIRLAAETLEQERIAKEAEEKRLAQLEEEKNAKEEDESWKRWVERIEADSQSIEAINAFPLTSDALKRERAKQIANAKKAECESDYMLAYAIYQLYGDSKALARLNDEHPPTTLEDAYAILNSRELLVDKVGQFSNAETVFRILDTIEMKGQYQGQQKTLAGDDIIKIRDAEKDLRNRWVDRVKSEIKATYNSDAMPEFWSKEYFKELLKNIRSFQDDESALSSVSRSDFRTIFLTFAYLPNPIRQPFKEIGGYYMEKNTGGVYFNKLSEMAWCSYIPPNLIRMAGMAERIILGPSMGRSFDKMTKEEFADRIRWHSSYKKNAISFPQDTQVELLTDETMERLVYVNELESALYIMEHGQSDAPTDHAGTVSDLLEQAFSSKSHKVFRQEKNISQLWNKLSEASEQWFPRPKSISSQSDYLENVYLPLYAFFQSSWDLNSYEVFSSALDAANESHVSKETESFYSVAQMVVAYNVSYDAICAKLHSWYFRDKNVFTDDELEPANSAYHEGKFTESIKEFNKLLSVNPDTSILGPLANFILTNLGDKKTASSFPQALTMSLSDNGEIEMRKFYIRKGIDDQLDGLWKNAVGRK